MLTKCGKMFENKLDEYSELIDKLSDLKFELEISHLVDVFEQLNNLNSQLRKRNFGR